MWYGCYILRKENEALRKSFVLTSCILVIFTFVEIIRATPWIGLSSISVVKANLYAGIIISIWKRYAGFKSGIWWEKHNTM